MTNDEEKLNNEQIEAQLDSNESTKVSKAVGMLKDEDPSMAWRSQLNAKILAEAQAKRKRLSISRLWSYSAGLSLSTAAAVALFLFFAPQEIHQAAPRNLDTIESQMVAAHHSAVRSADAAGDGLSALDEVELTASKDVNDWKKEDLEAL